MQRMEQRWERRRHAGLLSPTALTIRAVTPDVVRCVRAVAETGAPTSPPDHVRTDDRAAATSATPGPASRARGPRCRPSPGARRATVSTVARAARAGSSVRSTASGRHRAGVAAALDPDQQPLEGAHVVGARAVDLLADAAGLLARRPSVGPVAARGRARSRAARPRRPRRGATGVVRARAGGGAGAAAPGPGARPQDEDDRAARTTGHTGSGPPSVGAVGCRSRAASASGGAWWARLVARAVGAAGGARRRLPGVRRGRAGARGRGWARSAPSRRRRSTSPARRAGRRWCRASRPSGCSVGRRGSRRRPGRGCPGPGPSRPSRRRTARSSRSGRR